MNIITVAKEFYNNNNNNDDDNDNDRDENGPSH